MIIRQLLGALLAFSALNAFGGGAYALAGAPGVPIAWLAGTPFPSYVVPGLILFFVVGGAFAFAAVAVFARLPLARPSALAAGTIVLIWIGVQLAMIGYVSWLQPAVAMAGSLVILLAWHLPGLEPGP